MAQGIRSSQKTAKRQLSKGLGVRTKPSGSPARTSTGLPSSNKSTKRARLNPR